SAGRVERALTSAVKMATQTPRFMADPSFTRSLAPRQRSRESECVSYGTFEQRPMTKTPERGRRRWRTVIEGHSRVLREIERIREHASRIPLRQRSQAFHEIQCPVTEPYPHHRLRREGARETCGASLLLLNERTHATFVGGERGDVIATAPSQLASQDVCAEHCEGRTRARK